MFEKSLTDLVKGIRASRRDTPLYISSCIAEIKSELSSTDPYVKSNALQKLTFLQMMGYDMSWANFATIEVMSFPKFAYKRIGYLAACQSFTQETDVILLTTNLLKKEIRGGGINLYEVGLALNCLSNIVTADLARELLPDVTTLVTSHQSPYIRKKAILCLFKLFIKYPQGLRLCFDKVRSSLEDSDPSVVSCAVNVITELSDKNPKNYLNLAPQFFGLLTSTINNWMLIKVVKLLGSLVSEEPRLARKLLDPLVNIVKSTQAKSLLYEAVFTITLALPYCHKSDGSLPSNVPDIVRICSDTLASFVRDTDPNLKYLGLVGFGSLVESQNKVLIGNAEIRNLVLLCLTDEDVTIRSRALDLLSYMATKKNLQDLIEQLVLHIPAADEGSYKRELIKKIISLCSMDKYSLLTDFSWYVRILLQLSMVRGIQDDDHTIGNLIQSQIMDVALRVLPVRVYMVRCMLKILVEFGTEDKDITEKFHNKNIYAAAAWCIGEYAHLISESIKLSSDGLDEFIDLLLDSSPYQALLSSLLCYRTISEFDSYTQALYLQCAGKVFAIACDEKEKDIALCVAILQDNLPLFSSSVYVEVQERALSLFYFLTNLNIIGEDSKKPKLREVDEDDDSENDEQNLSQDDDLLNILSPTANKTLISKQASKSRQKSDTLPQIKCHQLGAFMKSIFLPDPMKPISIKSQKKKKQSLNLNLIQPSTLAHYQHNKKASFEEISFIQQRPTSFLAPTPMVQEDIFDTPTNDTTQILADTSSYHDKPMQPQNNSQQQQTPFYLQSTNTLTDTFNNSPQQLQPPPSSKFGAIYLNFDTNEAEMKQVDPAEETTTKKKKKKSKKKKEVMNDADLAIFSSNIKPIQSSAEIVTVYNSEDEDDEGELIKVKNKSKKKMTNQEFENLAMVDLTKPLQEDEVMPVTRHRQVVVNNPIPVEPNKAQEQVEKVKSKKKKKKKKDSQNNDHAMITANANASVDLLGLGGSPKASKEDENSTIHQKHIPLGEPVTTSNPIDSAFDDLLDLSHSPIPQKPMLQQASGLSSSHNNHNGIGNKELNTNLNNTGSNDHLKIFESLDTVTEIPSQQAAASSKSSTKKIWLNGTIKSNSFPKWEKVSFQYRLNSSKKKQRNSATITFRLFNNDSQNYFHDVSLTLQNIPSLTELGSMSPNESLQSSSIKLDSLFQAAEEMSITLKGRLKDSESEVPVKVVIPTSLIFFGPPEQELTLTQVMKELSNKSNWYSQTVKLHTDKSIELVISKLESFFHASRVSEGMMEEVILASQSQTSLLRVLIKNGKQTNVIKLDMKCTDENILKCLASDTKRIDI